MSRFKLFAALSCLGLLALTFVPAQADQWNKKTILTVNEAVTLPNATLQPGKYVMKLMDSQSNRHIVQVFDEGEKNLITTILAIPNYRLTPADESQFGFWETAAGQPRALRSWFYPGDNFGQEFAYPKDTALQIAKASNQNVPAIMSGEAESAEVRAMTPSGETRELETREQETGASASTSTTTEQQSAATTTTPEQPAAPTTQQPADESMKTGTGTGQQTQAQPQTDTSATASAQPAQPESSAQAESQAAAQDPGMTASAQRSELPRTASPLPLIALAGLASAAAAAAARVARKRG